MAVPFSAIQSPRARRLTAAIVDRVLEATVVGSISRIGIDVRGRIHAWGFGSGDDRNGEKGLADRTSVVGGDDGLDGCRNPRRRVGRR
jgi:hypothetical protein